MIKYEQGDILKVEGITRRLLVVSNNTFNMAGMAMCCPLYSDIGRHPLHIRIDTADNEKYIAPIEQTKLVDISSRGYMAVSRIGYSDLMNVSDALQALFEY